MVSDLNTSSDESNGGENNIENIHEQVQAAMKPYTDEILNAKHTSIFAEDDENWYLSVHWGEWDALLSDDVLTSEEHDAISSKYHDIVGDKWRNDDPENRWSNAAPYGDNYAFVLEKPSEDSEDDSNEPEFSVGTEWDAVHEQTDGFTIYSRNIVRVQVADYNEYYDLEMLDSDGEVVVVRNISPGRVEANLEANDGAFCILVPEDESEVATDGGEGVEELYDDLYAKHDSIEWLQRNHEVAVGKEMGAHAEAIERRLEELANDGDDEPVTVTGYVCVAPGERVETDTPVDATVSQMIDVEERVELIRVCATIVLYSDADLTPTLVDMLDEIADQSDVIQNSVRDIMVTYDD